MMEEQKSDLTVGECWEQHRRDAFNEWLKKRCDEDENPWGIEKHAALLFEAFIAGENYGDR